MTLLKIEDLTIAFGTAAPVVDGVSIGTASGRRSRVLDRTT